VSNVWLLMRRELSAYARTPSGYLIAAAVLFLNGILFNARAVGSVPKRSAEVLQDFFMNAGGVAVVAAVVFSMRLLAEDRSVGAQTLLLTSPIREVEIVLGKYLSALIVLSLLTLLSVYLPALIFIHGRVSFGHIFAGYLGMLLLGAAILAIGTFASSMVSSPFYAVILTAVIVAGLELSWWVAALAEGGRPQSVIAWAAPYMQHFHPFERGLLQATDVVYYLGVVYLGLLAATRTLESQRWR
jgi:ABC-2 type transport system permease protein